MKILVAVKEVAEAEDDFEIEGLDIASQYLEYDLNEWDEYAIEAAVQIKEAADEEVEVVTVTIGPERAEETIRMALAKEADRAVRVWDDTVADAGFLDVHAKKRILRAVCDDEDPDLVLSGVQASDDSHGATGVALADALDFQWAAVVNELNYEAGDDVAEVHRELEGGVDEVTEIDMPAVLTIQTGINEPRYASLRGIRQAQSKEIAVQTLDDVGLASDVLDSSLEVTSMSEPETTSDVTIFEGDPASTAAELASVLRDKGVGAE